jgi:D-alanine-D-alanine ligase
LSHFAILFGGVSYEHEISIVSAITLKDVIEKDKIFIFCDENREFYLIEEKDMKASYFSRGEYKKCEKLSLKQGGFYQKALFKEKKIELSTLINLIHGKEGEDGTVSALLDFFGIKYIGPRIEGSVISYNKEFTKIYAKSKKVDVLDYQVLNSNDKRSCLFDYPVIIKPLRLGSSIGLSVAKNDKEFDYALDVAFEFDNSVIIEPFYDGIKEYNLAGAKTKDGYIFSFIEEPIKESVLDFDKKYLDFSRSEGANKADLPRDIQDSIKEAFIKLYDGLFEGAIVRCDFFAKDNKLYINEINPVPGSLANYLFDDFNEILSKIHIPRNREIPIEYRYINSINAAKGK